MQVAFAGVNAGGEPDAAGTRSRYDSLCAADAPERSRALSA